MPAYCGGPKTLVRQECGSTLPCGVIGKAVGSLWIAVGCTAGALNVASGRCEKRGNGLGVSDNALQIPLFYQVGDLFFPITPSSH